MKLIDYLKKNKLSQAKFSRTIGIHRNHLNWIVHGKGNPGLPLALRISKATNGEVTLEDLISDQADFELELENDEVKINFEAYNTMTQANSAFTKDWTI